MKKATPQPFSVILLVVSLFYALALPLSAETVSGGGYVLEQTITPLESTLEGNGYVLQQSTQQNGGTEQGGGYTVTGVYGGSQPAQAATTTLPTPPVVTPPISSGGGYYIFPAVTATSTISTSTLPKIPVIKVETASGTVTYTGSTCRSRVTFSGPIDYGLETNTEEDVKKLEIFLNTYENERLEVNGVYEKKDVEAVKRWQKKYRSFILDPMRLKNPTGTVYTLSQRQIERQTTKACGEPIVVTSCPFFKETVVYGDTGDAVRKVQTFLNLVQGEKLATSGVYGPVTRAAVKRFQLAYKKDFFTTLKSLFISGNWNKATQIKANKAIGCSVTS